MRKARRGRHCAGDTLREMRWGRYIEGGTVGRHSDER